MSAGAAGGHSVLPDWNRSQNKPPPIPAVRCYLSCPVTRPWVVRTIWPSRVSNCVLAGRTEYAVPYKRNAAGPVGKRLFAIWQDMADRLEPGAEQRLVDEFARVLRLDQLN